MHFTVTCPSCDSDFPIDSEKVPDGGVNAICSTCEGEFFVQTPWEDDAGSTREAASEAETAEATQAEAPEADETAAAQEFDQFFEPVMSADDDEVTADPESGDEGAVAAVEDRDGADAGDQPVADDADFELGGDDLATVGEATEVEDPVAGDGEPDDPEAGSFAGLETGVEEEEAVEEPADAPATPSFGRRDPHDKAKRLARVLVQDIIAYNQELHSTAKANDSLKEDMAEEVAKSWEEFVDQVGSEIAESTTYFRDALNDILADGEEVFDGPP